LNVTCSSEANKIEPPFSTNQTIELILEDQINKYFYFANFSCKYPSCCSLNKTSVVSLDGLTGEPLGKIETKETDLPERTNQIEISTKVIQRFSFRFSFITYWPDSQQIVSEKVYLRVAIKCEVDKFFINPEFPEDNTYVE